MLENYHERNNRYSFPSPASSLQLREKQRRGSSLALSSFHAVTKHHLLRTSSLARSNLKWISGLLPCSRHIRLDQRGGTNISFVESNIHPTVGRIKGRPESGHGRPNLFKICKFLLLRILRNRKTSIKGKTRSVITKSEICLHFSSSKNQVMMPLIITAKCYTATKDNPT